MELTWAQVRAWRRAMELGAESLDDKTASQAPMMFRRLKRDGSLITAGTRIQWQGAVLRAAADLWDTAENVPDLAPGLWEPLDYRDGIRVIPAVITAGTAFSRGEQGWWNGVVYVSLLNSNVWTPAEYPAGWEAV